MKESLEKLLVAMVMKYEGLTVIWAGLATPYDANTTSKLCK